MIDERGVRELH